MADRHMGLKVCQDEGVGVQSHALSLMRSECHSLLKMARIPLNIFNSSRDSGFLEEIQFFNCNDATCCERAIARLRFAQES